MPTRLEIRRLNPGEPLGPVIALRRRVLVEHEGFPESILSAPLERTRGYHLVAAIGGQDVGVLTLVESTAAQALLEENGLSLSLAAYSGRYTRFAVLPEYRQRGVGGMLMAAALLTVHLPLKLEWSWLSLAAPHVERASAYERLGYAPAAAIVSPLGRSYVMTRDESVPNALNVNRRLLHVMSKALAERSVRLDAPIDPIARPPRHMAQADAQAQSARRVAFVI